MRRARIWERSENKEHAEGGPRNEYNADLGGKIVRANREESKEGKREPGDQGEQ